MLIAAFMPIEEGITFTLAPKCAVGPTKLGRSVSDANTARSACCTTQGVSNGPDGRRPQSDQADNWATFSSVHLKAEEALVAGHDPPKFRSTLRKQGVQGGMGAMEKMEKLGVAKTRQISTDEGVSACYSSGFAPGPSYVHHPLSTAVSASLVEHGPGHGRSQGFGSFVALKFKFQQLPKSSHARPWHGSQQAGNPCLFLLPTVGTVVVSLARGMALNRAHRPSSHHPASRSFEHYSSFALLYLPPMALDFFLC